MQGIIKAATNRNIAIVEDCAQAHGCTYERQARRPFWNSAAATASTNSKHVSCGDGGIVLTNDAEFARRLRFLATDKAYSREPGVSRSPEFLANNYRMTELQGAVALAQTRKVADIVQRRRKWCTQLTEHLKNCRGLTLPKATPGCEHSYWFYMMRVIPAKLGADADEFAAALKAEGLPVSAHYIGQPIYQYPLFVNHSAYAHGSHPFAARKYEAGICPNAEEILHTCVNLQINEAYGDMDLEETCARDSARRQMV